MASWTIVAVAGVRGSDDPTTIVVATSVDRAVRMWRAPPPDFHPVSTRKTHSFNQGGRAEFVAFFQQVIG